MTVSMFALIPLVGLVAALAVMYQKTSSAYVKAKVENGDLLAEKMELDRKASHFERECQDLRHELRLARKVAKEIVPRLVRIRVDEGREFDKFRVCVGISRQMVEHAFFHGGDDEMIRYAAQEIGRAVEVKMVQFNFGRCERPF